MATPASLAAFQAMRELSSSTKLPESPDHSRTLGTTSGAGFTAAAVFAGSSRLRWAKAEPSADGMASTSAASKDAISNPDETPIHAHRLFGLLRP